MHKVRSIVYFLVAICNVILTICAVLFLNSIFVNEPEKMQSYAGVAAAFMTMFCFICGNTVFMNIYYHKKVGLNIISFWKGILRLVPGFILPAIAGFGIAYLIPVNSYWTFLLDGIIFMVVYFISVWFLSMNRYEKDLISLPIKRLVRKIKK